MITSHKLVDSTWFLVLSCEGECECEDTEEVSDDLAIEFSSLSSLSLLVKEAVVEAGEEEEEGAVTVTVLGAKASCLEDSLCITATPTQSPNTFTVVLHRSLWYVTDTHLVISRCLHIMSA